MSDEKVPEIEITKEISEAEQYKNEANDYFKSEYNTFFFSFFPS